MSQESLDELAKLLEKHTKNTAIRNDLFVFVNKLQDTMYWDKTTNQLVVPLESIKTELELALEGLTI